MSQHLLLQAAATLLTLGAVGVYLIQDSIWFIAPMMIVVMAFAIAIPNVLSMALSDYKQQVGSAAALFGLIYYLLIGNGLGLAGAAQNLGLVLIACGVGTLVVTLSRSVLSTIVVDQID